MNRLFKLVVFPIFPELNIYPGAHTFVSSTGMSSAPSSPVTPLPQVPVSLGGLRHQQVGFPTLRAMEPQIRRPEWEYPGPPERGFWGSLGLGLELFTPNIWPFVPRESGYRFRVRPGNVRTGVQG